MGTDAFRQTQRLRWDVTAQVHPLSRTIDAPASPDPVLELACFVKPPRICFENVKIGSTKVKTLRIFNPGEEVESVVLEKFPDPDLGFMIEGLEQLNQQLCLQLEPKEEIEIKISWQPVSPGNSRHLASFKWIGGQKLQLVILASAYDPNAGKKKRVRRIPTRKALQPSHRLNIQREEIQVSRPSKRLVNQHRPNIHDSPNVKNLVEIAPDTPTRRSTFTVTESAFEKNEGQEMQCEEKENVSVPNYTVNRDTFNVERNNVTDEKDGERKRKTVMIPTHGNGQKLDFKAVSFASKTSDDDLSMEGNTFHESEIRLSSSPIKWCVGYERFTSSKYKHELHPGQVVLNGEVKHEFIPYPSFDNTDTFLNIEMSTSGKHKCQQPDESLSFDSAASSLFTITCEEKFNPNLESVKESGDLLATPKASELESKTLTNDTCAATPQPNENGTWIRAVKEAEDVSFAVTREEKFCPILEPVKEYSNVFKTPKGFESESRTLTNDTCAFTPLLTGNGTFVNQLGNNTGSVKENHDVPETPRAYHSKTLTNESCGKTPVPAEQGTWVQEDGMSGDNDQPTNMRKVETSSTDAIWSLDEALEKEKSEDNAKSDNCHDAQKSPTRSIQTEASDKEREIRQNIILGNDDISVCKDILGHGVDRQSEKGVHAKESMIDSTKAPESLKEESRVEVKESSYIVRHTAKKTDFTQKQRAPKELKSMKKKEGEKIVQSRYMNTNATNKKLLQIKQKEESAKKQPKKDGNVIDAKFKGVSLPQKRRGETGTSLGESVKPSVAIKKLKLTKPREKIAKHPMPYAAKNMFYDERWIEKEERGFKNWLNFVLTPPDDDAENGADVERGTVCLESDSNQPVAPTKEMLSFRMYAAKRRMAKLRRDACMLYQTDQFASVIHKLEREIEHGRLAIRTDRHVDADLGVRKHIADMLLSFNPLWLRIGLEVVYGEIIPMSNNDDASSLSRFIHRRLLGNPDIAYEYSHPSVPGLYKQGYVEALGKFTLKKLLLVIIYLDKAKISRLISHDPCLFNKDSQFKSIREMLLMFSRDYLHREGDIVKHLTYLGYTVSHVQTALHEYDFGVINLAVDLRDGLRLVRVVELLTQNWNLSSRLRVPAVSRLQKIHNVELAFQGLRERNLDVKKECNTDARFVVDGHREKTLSLLWKIIFHFQVDVLLDEEKLKDEIKYLERKIKLMKDYNGFRQSMPLKAVEDEAFENNLYNKSEKLGLLLKWCCLVGKLHGVKIENFTVSFSDGRALCYLLNHYHPALLTKDEIIDETTVTCSMTREGDSDGEIDDCLIYQNLTKSYCSSTGTNMMLETLLANEKHNLSIFCEKVKEIGGSPAMILASDMSNTIPDEKVIIAYLSFFCSRLLDLREEIRAARCIQMAWRQHHLHTKMKGQLIEVNAANKLQAIARGFLARRRLQQKRDAIMILQRNIRRFLSKKRQCLREYSAVVIQQHYKAMKQSRLERKAYLKKKAAAMTIQRAYRERRQIRIQLRHSAARCIQRAWQKHQSCKLLCKRKQAAVIIQRVLRGYVDRRCFLVIRNATLTLQSRTKAYLEKVKARREFLNKREAVLMLQRCWRETLIRREANKVAACVVIQACFRGHQRRKSYLELKEAVIKIQSFIRSYQHQNRYEKLKSTVMCLQRTRRSLVATRNARSAFQSKKNACITLQKIYRGRVVRWDFVALKTAAVKLQATWRGKVCRQEFIDMKLAACRIQIAFRAWKIMSAVRMHFIHMKKSSIKIQSAFKGFRQRKEFLALQRATLKAQALYRGKVCREKFLSSKAASITIQRHYRAICVGRKTRMQYQQVRNSCIKIQAWYKGRCSQKLYVKIKQAAVCLQSSYKRLVAVRRFQRIKNAVLVLQHRYRAVKSSQATQVHFLITKAAVIKIQSVYRGYQVRKNMAKRTSAAQKIQAVFRMHKAHIEYARVKRAAICIQDRYRATKQAERQFSEFKRMRNATVVLQAAFRGYVERREIQRQAKAAITLQSLFKGHLQKQRYQTLKHATLVIQRFAKGYIERREYQRMRSAAVIIQRAYIGYLQMKAAVDEFEKGRASVLKIQAVTRGFLCRKLLKRHKAARKLQAVIRGHLQRKKYLRLLAVVVKLQTGMRKRLECIRRKDAALCIQQQWRASKVGQHVRADYRRKRQACITLQSYIRMLVEKRRFTRCKWAALIIQRRFRAQCIMKRKRKEYQRIKKGAILIQSMYRMHLAKMQFNVKKEAVSLLQAHARILIAKRKYHRESQAASVIQRRYKARKEMREQRSVFLQQRNAVISMQAHARGLLARKRCSKIKNATVKIQAWYRMVTTKRCYAMKRNAILTIQRRYRAFVACQMQQLCFHLMRGAAITIQACFRGFIMRRSFLQKRKATVCIQATWRRHVCEQKYKTMRQTAIQLQRRVRANALARTERRSFVLKRNSAMKIQRRLREFFALKKATIFVQAQRRMLHKRRHFLLKRSCCIKIQQCFRRYAKKKSAAITIQSVWRMHSARKAYVCKRDACVKIQAAVRGFLAHKSYMLHLGAALCIQRRYRAYLKGSSERRKFERTRRSCVLIQACIRGWMARKAYVDLKQKAMVIQGRFRAHIAMKRGRSKFVEFRSAAVKIQAFYRGYKARAQVGVVREQRRMEEALRLAKEHEIMMERHRAATVIQKNFKGLKARTEYLRLMQSTIKLQRFYRSHLLTLKTRNEFVAKCKSAVMIQCAYRVYCARKRLKELKEERNRLNNAAVIVQSVFRCVIERQLFLKKKNAVIAIQKYFRCHLSTKRVRGEFILQKACAIRIQATYRSYIAKKLLRSLQKRRDEEIQAAIMIQKLTRGYLCRRGYTKLRAAVVVLQRGYRSIKETARVRNEYNEKRNAVLKIQRSYRSHLTRKTIAERITKKKEREKSATKIQRYFRRYKFVSNLKAAVLTRRSAAVTIQRSFRGLVAKRQVQRFRAAIIIQRAYSEYKQEKNASRNNAATRIQAAFRGYSQRKYYQQLKAVVVMVQERVRELLCKKRSAKEDAAAFVIQHWYRSVSLMKREMIAYKEQRKAALRIQSYWRGYVVRRSIVDRKMIRARERIESANSEATEPKKLCNRTKSALSYLLNCRNVSTIYEALRNLEVSTRLSTKCCERLVEDNALPVIFQIIRNCNRSLPSIGQIHMALLVLTNVAKCSTTYMAIVEEKDSLQLLIELMTNFREKMKIFPNSCVLLSVLCNDKAVAQYIQKSSILSKKLNALNSLINRKAQIELKRTNGKLKLRKDEKKDPLPIIEQMKCLQELIDVIRLA